MHFQSAEQTLFNFLILGKSRFPPKKFYNIDYWSEWAYRKCSTRNDGNWRKFLFLLIRSTSEFIFLNKKDDDDDGDDDGDKDLGNAACSFRFSWQIKTCSNLKTWLAQVLMLMLEAHNWFLSHSLARTYFVRH